MRNGLCRPWGCRTVILFSAILAWSLLAEPSAQPAATTHIAAKSRPAAVIVPPRVPPGHPHSAEGYYPDTSVLCREEGRVFLEITIARDGSVVATKLVKSSGYPDLDAAAARAVRAWKYLPALLDGKPVQAHKTVAVVFYAGSSNVFVIAAVDYMMSLGCRVAKAIVQH